MNTNSRHWFFTWYSYQDEVKLPTKSSLIKFFNYTCDHVCFQKERGKIAKKLHWQGCLTLTGVRQSKKSVLELFKYRFKNVSGLTLSRTHSKEAAESYVTKSETRVEGPFYAGKKNKFSEEFANSIELRAWQNDLFNFLKQKEKFLRNRKVIYVEDTEGGWGKSTFVRWLRIGQKDFSFRALPISGVDRLASAVNAIIKDSTLDIVGFDLTREQGRDQTKEDLFAAIESIKNGYVIDVMYGKFNEAIFDPPILIIFSNIEFLSIRRYLSYDRWIVCKPTKDGLIVSDKNAIHPGSVTPINFKLYKNSSYSVVTKKELDTGNDVNKI